MAAGYGASWQAYLDGGLRRESGAVADGSWDALFVRGAVGLAGPGRRDGLTRRGGTAMPLC